MRAILFDFGGTLDTPRHWLDRFLEHYRRAGIEVERAELDPAFDAATRTAYGSSALLRTYGLAELIPFLVGLQLTCLRDKPPLATRAAGLVKRLRDDGRRNELARFISDNFIAESAIGLARSRAILARLARDFVIGVVSNFYGNLDRILRDAGFDGLLATVADSGRLGIYKPAPGIYRAALEALRVEPHEVLMVGDSLTKDCAPAHRLGLKTVWLRHEGASSDLDGQSVADFTITSLEQLYELQWLNS